jgi:hypothetical protein
MPSHLVMLANGRFMSVLLHDLNGAVVSSHMQSVLDSHSLPRTIAMCAGSFYLRSQNFHAKVALQGQSCPVLRKENRHTYALLPKCLQ